MRKLLYILLVGSLVASCSKKNDRAFDESPDQRVNEVLNKYQKQLETATYGWKAAVITDSGRGTAYSFYFNFDSFNRVKMYSDFTDEFATVSKESSYRLKALQQVSLLFDTYNYIHVLADPDPSVAGGATGSGYNVDFEFYFDDNSTADTIHLVGRKHGNTAVLVRANKAEADAYAAGGLKSSFAFDEQYGDILQYWKIVKIDGVTYQLTASPDSKGFIVAWKDADGTAHVVTTNYYFTSNGIELVTPIVNGATVINSFTNLTWNSATSSINAKLNGTTSVTISGAAAPAYVDLNAPANWYQAGVTAATFWYSDKGFHMNGVDDALGLVNSTGTTAYPIFWYLAYYPGYNTTNRPNYDLCGPFYRTADYSDRSLALGGTAPQKPTFNATSGRVTFSELGTFGTLPASGPWIDTRALLYGTSWYAVKTSSGTYDLVSYADSKTWISWQLAQ
ncbi:protein of unknown function [Filimonas lacunae]|uniref:DUF4302 domain-containing protein n=1 Tax=Filimonas lacunae TaxID=477680 RepID=A0A173MDT5_9BACT|nr:DUF4302 domain-containing protein [Filimonas lacunae]BAV05690.1 hypothetical protein FLA_1702 [Filimonas lacunae]SIT28890.1 protein of unknown function [Filimonas lacunae]